MAAKCAVLPTANAGQYARWHCKLLMFWFPCKRWYVRTFSHYHLILFSCNFAFLTSTVDTVITYCPRRKPIIIRSNTRTCKCRPNYAAVTIPNCSRLAKHQLAWRHRIPETQEAATAATVPYIPINREIRVDPTASSERHVPRPGRGGCARATPGLHRDCSENHADVAVDAAFGK